MAKISPALTRLRVFQAIAKQADPSTLTRAVFPTDGASVRSDLQPCPPKRTLPLHLGKYQSDIARAESRHIDNNRLSNACASWNSVEQACRRSGGKVHQFDPYFDQYGGRSEFLRIVHIINNQSIACAFFVDAEKLCPTQPEDEAEGLDVSSAIWEQYKLEVLDHMEPIWAGQLRKKLEAIDQDLVSTVDECFSCDRHRLSPEMPELSVQSNTFRTSVSDQDQMSVVVLSHSRCVVEDLRDVVVDLPNYQYVGILRV